MKYTVSIDNPCLFITAVAKDRLPVFRTDAIKGLPDPARARLAVLTRRRRDADGRLLVTSAQSRHQSQNLDDAREKVRALVLEALTRDVPRRPTRPASASEERRIRNKKRRAETKRWRGSATSD